MKNMIKNMKAVIGDRLVNVESIEGLDSIHSHIHEASFRPYDLKDIVLLPTFPEYKDGEPQFWSGDIIKNERGGLQLIVYGRYGWERAYNINGEKSGVLGIIRRPITYGFVVILRNNYTRICSAFDKDAAKKTGLDQQTIESLRDIVRGK